MTRDLTGFISVEEITATQNVHKLTVMFLVKNNVITSKKVGSKWYVNKEQFTEWYEKFTAGIKTQ